MTQPDVEILVSEIGDVTIVTVPFLEFTSEGFRISDTSIELFGEGRALIFQADEATLLALSESGSALLIEKTDTGTSRDRETDLLLEAV